MFIRSNQKTQIMKRREFIKKSIGAGLFTGSLLSMGSYGKILANTTNNKAVDYDLVVTKGGEPDRMFDRSIEAMGGIRKYVKRGQKVVVKPNIAWDYIPEEAANTNPKLVKRVVEHCLNAGASRVYVFDHTIDEWRKCYKNSGIEKAAKEAGATVAPGHTENYYHPVEIERGQRLTEVKEHELLQEADVFINVPILKHHSSTQLSVAMKNLMGNVWDRHFWHRNNLERCIADYASHRLPDLNVVDAYRVLMRRGPNPVTVNDSVYGKYLVLSDDIVAADAASAKIFGSLSTTTKNPRVPYIGMGAEMGYGQDDLSKLNIERIKI